MMLKLLKEDYQNNSLKSFLILFWYRILNNLYKRKQFFILRIMLILFDIVKIMFSLQSHISYKAQIGRNIRLPHSGFGVVISSKAKIGNNVTIYHLVTIGINENKCNSFDKFCVEIGDNCYLSTGAKIISVKLSEGVKVGPNAVVHKNVKKGVIIVSINQEV